jgi:hypothetical protein
MRAQAIRRWIGTLRRWPVHPPWLLSVGQDHAAFYRVLAGRGPRSQGGAA